METPRTIFTNKIGTITQEALELQVRKKQKNKTKGSLFCKALYFQFSSGKEFWLGLDNMFYLTREGNYSLRLKMMDLDQNQEQVMYSNFQILDQVNKCHTHYSSTNMCQKSVCLFSALL